MCVCVNVRLRGLCYNFCADVLPCHLLACFCFAHIHRWVDAVWGIWAGGIATEASAIAAAPAIPYNCSAIAVVIVLYTRSRAFSGWSLTQKQSTAPIVIAAVRGCQCAATYVCRCLAL
jgi:hypothetical protein